MVPSLHEIGRVRACKDVGLNILECIDGMGVPKGLPGGKKIGRDERIDVRMDSRQ